MPPADRRNLREKWQKALEARGRSASGSGGAKGPEPVRSKASDPGADSPVRTRKPTPDPVRPEEAERAPEVPVSPAPPKAPAPSAVARPDPEKAPEKPAKDSPSWTGPLALIVLIAGLGIGAYAWFSGASARDSELAPAEVLSPPSPSDSASASGSASAAPVPPAAPSTLKRCAAPSAAPFVVGDPPAATPDGEDDDPLAPFAAEVGRAATFGLDPSQPGFVIGIQRPGEGGSVGMVATLGTSGDSGKLVRLARSRGDFDAPVVVGAGGDILAAMVEPHAGGRSIRVAKISGERVTWGPELSERNDESLATDLATNGDRGMIVWDDLPLGRERSVIQLARFDLGTMHSDGARPVTPPEVDADSPRLVRRPGGYWLSYLAHGEPAPTPSAAVPGEAPKKDKDEDDEEGTRAPGEEIAYQWIEIVPLDETGAKIGSPRAVTSKTGRVLGFDLAANPEGKLLIVFRDDDTPSGSHGGSVSLLTADLGGVGEEVPVADEGVGAGVPRIFLTGASGWIVIHSLSGAPRLLPLSAAGEPQGALAIDPGLGTSEVIAAGPDSLLLATPAGKAMKLSVVRCAAGGLP